MTNNQLLKQVIFILCFGINLCLNAQTIHYVKAVASGSEDGTSWANASSNLQEMIGISMASDQIWVAAGTYKPTQDPFGNFSPIDARDKTFYLKDSVKIYGGFIGNENALSQRDWEANLTTLSGDFNDNDIVSGSGASLAITGNTENAYHVVISIKDSKETVLDGFTIKGGNATGSSYLYVEGISIDKSTGGGLITSGDYWTKSQLMVSNCIIANNSTLYGSAGGVYVYGTYSNVTFHNVIFTKNKGTAMSINDNSTTPLISMCTFSDNYRGGIYNSGASPIIINSVFENNWTNGDGGGINNNGGSPQISNTIFKGNVAPNGFGGGICNSEDAFISNCFFIDNSAINGGGVYNYGSNANFTNVLFDNNTCTTNGGGMYNQLASPILTNCTFTRNSTPSTSGGGGIHNKSSNPIIKNCIIWGNISAGGTPSLYNDNCTPSVDYSTVEWPIIYPGTGNKKTNPLFVDITDPDGVDNIWGNDDDGLMLQAASPAINNGTLTNAPTMDIRGKIRVGNPDMGAYEFGGLTNETEAFPNIVLNVFPNPVSDILVIKIIDYNLPMALYDSQGKLIKCTNFTPIELDMKDLPTGLYFLRIGNFSTKIQKI